MATATYQRTTDVGLEPDRKALSLVAVDGANVEVAWWPSLKDQWGVDGVKAYLEAEALFATGNYADAQAKLMPLATGTGDTANWAQRWIDEHPVPAPVPADPLL